MAALLCTVLAGCFPMLHKYERPIVEDGEYFGEYCHGGAGPPSVAYFPVDEIYLSIGIDRNFNESDEATVGISIPRDVVAQVLDRYLAVYTSLESKPLYTELRPISPEPSTAWLLKYVPVNADKNSYFEPVSGASRKIERLFGADQLAHKTLLFASALPVESSQIVSIKFPNVSVNGRQIDGPTMKIKRSVDFELSPINC